MITVAGPVAEAGFAGFLARIRSLFTRQKRPQTPRPGVRPSAGRRASAEPDLPPIDVPALLQDVWGEGCLWPGGIEQGIDLVKPFGVTPDLSLLDLSAGLGGPTRRIAENFDVYITGLERDPECAARGHTLSVKAGLAKKVPISAYDPNGVTLKPRAFDGIFGYNLLSPVRDKQHLIRQMRHALKPGGQVTFRDWVLGNAGKPTPLLGALNRYERTELEPWSAAEIVRTLAEVGLDCRVSNDVSDLLIADLLKNWKNLLISPKLRADRRRELAVLAHEAEGWCVRLEALRSGQLRYYRFYAILPSR